MGMFSKGRGSLAAGLLSIAAPFAVMGVSSPAAAAEILGSAAIFTNRACAAEVSVCSGGARNYLSYVGGVGGGFAASATIPGGASTYAAVEFGDGYLPVLHASSTAGDLTRTGASVTAFRSYTYTGDAAIDLALGATAHYITSGDLLPGDAAGEGFFNAQFGILRMSDYAWLTPSSTAQDIVNSLNTGFPDCSTGAIAATQSTSAGTTGENSHLMSLSTACDGSTLRLNPGDQFVVVATLQAIANRDGFVDGSHTFTINYDTEHTYYAGTLEQVSPDVFKSITSAVPEPGTWALMIMGFGLTGARLRARRSATA